MINEANNLYKALVQLKRDGSLASYQEYEIRLEQFDLSVEYTAEYGHLCDDLDVLLQARNFNRLETLLYEMAPDMTIKSIMYDVYDIYIGEDEDGWFQMSDHDDDPVYEDEGVPLRKRKHTFPNILVAIMVIIVMIHIGRAIQSGDFAGYWEPEVTVPFDLR